MQKLEKLARTLCRAVQLGQHNRGLCLPQRASSERTRFYSCRKGSCGPCAKHLYMEPKCQVALITGGSTGIGLAIADQLLCEGAYRVVISGVDTCSGQRAQEELNRKYGENRACYVHMDVNCEKQFEDVMKEMVAKFGSIDILVNNAGMLNDKKWRETINTNLVALVSGTFLAFKFMRCQKKGGVVINNASILGFDPFPWAPIYCTTKHGVVGFTKSVGHKYYMEKMKTRVVALCPGVTETVLVSGSADKQADTEMGAKTKETLGSLPKQRPEVLGKAVAYMVRYAQPGTCWMVEDSQLFRARIPPREKIRDKIINL